MQMIKALIRDTFIFLVMVQIFLFLIPTPIKIVIKKATKPLFRYGGKYYKTTSDKIKVRKVEAVKAKKDKKADTVETESSKEDILDLPELKENIINDLNKLKDYYENLPLEFKITKEFNTIRNLKHSIELFSTPEVKATKKDITSTNKKIVNINSKRAIK